MVYSLLPKDLTIQNLLIFAAADVVPCSGCNMFPVHHRDADIFSVFLDHLIKFEKKKIIMSDGPLPRSSPAGT